MSASDSLFTAIKTLWDDNADASETLADIAGPYRNRKSGSEGFPYCVFISEFNQRTNTTSTSEYWESRFRLTLFDTTHALAEAALNEVGTVFTSGATLEISGEQVVLMRRQEEEYPAEQETESQPYEASLIFEVDWRKARDDQ